MRPSDRDRHEDDAADEIGRDHEPAPVPAVGGDTTVQAEEKRGTLSASRTAITPSGPPATNANHMSAMYWKASPSSLIATAA